METKLGPGRACWLLDARLERPTVHTAPTDEVTRTVLRFPPGLTGTGRRRLAQLRAKLTDCTGRYSTTDPATLDLGTIPPGILAGALLNP